MPMGGYSWSTTMRPGPSPLAHHPRIQPPKRGARRRGPSPLNRFVPGSSWSIGNSSVSLLCLVSEPANARPRRGVNERVASERVANERVASESVATEHGVASEGYQVRSMATQSSDFTGNLGLIVDQVASEKGIDRAVLVE